MRPTDENQPGSRRPNLMSSSRRTTGDINILAMLDGQASGRRPRVLPAALRYGAAGVLACSLVATLVWLVQDEAPARDAGKDDAARASLHAGTAGPGARPAGATALRDTQPASTHEVQLVVTQRDDLFPAGDSMPASVPGKGTAPAAETSASAAPGRVVPPLPVNATTRGAVIIDMQQPATTAPAHATAEGHATTHTTAQAAPPARMPAGSQKTPARTPTLARTVATTSHQKRGTAASGTASPSTVDRDVAVISAILQHTATHSEAADTASAPGCPDKSCATRMPSRQ